MFSLEPCWKYADCPKRAIGETKRRIMEAVLINCMLQRVSKYSSYAKLPFPEYTSGE
jgi:hypothetical protein